MTGSRLLWLSLVTGVLTALSLQVHAQGQDSERAAIDRAKRIFDQIRAEQFEAVAKEFNGQMSAALSPAQMREVWSSLQMQVGGFKSLLDERATTPQPGVTAVVLGAQFEKAPLNVIIAFDADNKIAGLRFTPRPSAAAAPPAAPTSTRFKEEEVTVGGGEWALPGTLSLPIGRIVAAVVLVHGSGPNDRDETLGPNKPFRDLAWGLADRDIAVLRYEKRTRQHGAKMATLPVRTVREEVIEDALAAVALMRSRRELASVPVFVLGHSLGGTLAPRIAADDRSIAGIIILAGATRPLPEVAREQLVYLSSLAGGAMNVDQALKTLMKSAPESYWKDLDSYKPAAVAATLKMPMLILQGERDYQVTMADVAGWREALGTRSDVVIKSYPALNHLFMTGEGKATPAEYDRPGKVAEFVIDDIAAWITRQTGVRPRV
jgi:alpha-beta hydrolase superfamily lysophospholipase